MTKLPTDSEYCDSLYERYHDPVWAEVWKKVMPLALAQYLAKENIEPPDGLVDEYSSPEASFRGRYIAAIRDFALHFLGEVQSQVKDIPVALLPTWQLNACATQTPRNGAAILLDSGTISSLTTLPRYYLTLSDYTGHPEFRDGIWEDLASGVVSLAAFCTSGDIDDFHRAHAFEDLPFLAGTKTTEPGGMLTTGLMCFILLHEYGHAKLGHLDPRNIKELQLKRDRVKIYNPSQLQEFEADEFAFAHLRRTIGPLESAFISGLLLKFFELCEDLLPGHSTTHPPSVARWKAIKELAELSAHPTSPAAILDQTFEEIREADRQRRA